MAKVLSRKVELDGLSAHISMADPIEIDLKDLELKNISVKVEGVTSLITHPWSAKQINAIADKHAGVGTTGRPVRVPSEEYEAAFYRFPDGRPGMCVVAFKDAAVTACTSLSRSVLNKAQAKQAFFIMESERGTKLVEVFHPKSCPPKMREDAVRVGMGGTDLRYRPEFVQWGVQLNIEYNARVISGNMLVNLLNLAGFAVGVGEWRVERNGDSGRFRVVEDFSWNLKK